MNSKRKRFCDEYLIDLNATQAAIRAGYSSRFANTNASKLLQNTTISQRIQKCMKDREVRTEIKQDRVVDELARIAFSDIGDYLKIETFKDGDVEHKRLVVFDTDTLPASKKASIQEIRQNIHGGISFKLHDKLKALELLGRHLGMFTDKVEFSGSMRVNNPFEGLTTEELKKLIS